MITVFSVDPPVAWSLMTEHKILARGRVPIRKGTEAAWTARWIDVINAHDPDIVGIEGVHLRTYGDDEPYVRTAKQRGAIVLARRAGIIEGLCRVLRPGVPIEIVDTGDWRETSGFKEKWGRVRLKDAAIALVKQLYGLNVTHDEADAILIGRHVAIVGALGRRM